MSDPYFNKILEKHALNNEDLVRASVEQLTFKQVQKAHRGKPVSANIQGKITRALNAVLGEDKYREQDLFH